jgi:hypothetical protein
MKEEEKLSGQVSDDQIAMWKKQYRDIFSVMAGSKICYLKRPDRNTLKATNAIAEQDGMRGNEVLLEGCWLGGDLEMKTNDEYFLEVVPVLEDIADFGRAELKKL